MSDYHILTINKNDQSLNVTIAYHLPISTELNYAGTATIRQAFLDDVSLSKTTIIPNLSTSHQDDINNGFVQEISENLTYFSSESVNEVKNRAKERYLGLLAQNAIIMPLRYKYWLSEFNVAT